MPHSREEVIAAIHTAFAASDEATALAVLDLYGIEPHERERERVQLAIVALSEGSEDKLLHFVQSAKADYRDVLSWQETGPLTPEQGKKEQEATLRIIEQWGKK
jgi:hypothetical protein